MKYSRQRELILNNVIESKGHPTADEVYDNLKKANPSLSLGTVDSAGKKWHVKEG